MTDYFTFAELIHTAKNIKNIPDWEQIANIKYLKIFLSSVRNAFAKPIRVNSGFRTPELNEMLGGSANSAHLKGLAADICAYSGTEADNRLLLKILESMLPYIDQLISYHKIEGDVKSPIRFIHVGLKKFPEQQRSQRLVK